MLTVAIQRERMTIDHFGRKSMGFLPRLSNSAILSTMLLSLLLLLLSPSVCIVNDEQQLLEHFLRAYDKSVRPVFNSSTVVHVHMGLTLTHIFNIDEKNQILTVNIWVEQIWHDERIRWNPSQFGNITKLTVPKTYIWTPDIVLYNNARDFSRGFISTNLHIDYMGGMQWAPPAKLNSICKLDVTFFPFDDQLCSLEFGSWIYDTRQLFVLIMDRANPFTRDSFTENGEWAIVNNRTQLVTRTNSAQKNGLFYSIIVFKLHLRRRTLYFMCNIIIPCIMLSVLTMMQFWLPCESGEKVTLGLTVLLAYSVFSFNIAESMPETSDVIPLIAIYLMGIMGISGTSVCMSVLVLSMRHGGDRGRPVPIWLQYVAYRILGRLMGWKDDRQTELTPHQTFGNVTNPLRSNDNDGDKSTRFNSLMKKKVNCIHDVSSMVKMDTLGRTQSLENVDDGHRRDTKCQSDGHLDAFDNRNRQLREQILRRAGHLTDRVDSERKTDQLIHQWRKVARIFDQFFFALIILITGGTTFVLLVLAPRFSHRSFDD